MVTPAEAIAAHERINERTRRLSAVEWCAAQGLALARIEAAKQIETCATCGARFDAEGLQPNTHGEFFCGPCECAGYEVGWQIEDLVKRLIKRPDPQFDTFTDEYFKAVRYFENKLKERKERSEA